MRQRRAASPLRVAAGDGRAKRTLVAGITAALLAVLTACGGSDSGGEKTLRVGTLSDSKPNAYQENGNYTGFDNELLRAIAAKQNLKLEFASTEFAALLGQVANGTFDIGSAGISQTEPRKKTVDFSAPYNYQALGIEAKDGAGITDEKSLAGKRVGVVQGTVSDTWLAENSPQAQAVRFPNDAAALAALKTAAIDAAVFDQATAEDYAAKNADAKLKVTKAIVTNLPHGFAFKKGNTELINKINEGLKAVIADGTWEKLIKQFEPNAPIPAEFKAK